MNGAWIGTLAGAFATFVLPKVRLRRLPSSSLVESGSQGSDDYILQRLQSEIAASFYKVLTLLRLWAALYCQTLC